MANYQLETGAGDDFTSVSKNAKQLAVEKGLTVEFDFNGVLCIVDKDTWLEGLYEHYCDAHIMEWKTIGPVCSDYDADTKIQLYTRRLERAKKEKIAQEEYDAKCKTQQKSVESQTAGIELELIPGKEIEYREYVEKNSDGGYSRAVIDYSEAWAKLMQVEIAKGKSVKDIAEATQKGLGYLGITGFQYGCAVQGLTHFWKHGEQLRKWHNKEYGHEGEGVVNPAILTISS